MIMITISTVLTIIVLMIKGSLGSDDDMLGPKWAQQFCPLLFSHLQSYLIAQLNLSVLGFSSVVFHDKAKRTQQGNLLTLIFEYFHFNFFNISTSTFEYFHFNFWIFPLQLWNISTLILKYSHFNSGRHTCWLETYISRATSCARCWNSWGYFK